MKKLYVVLIVLFIPFVFFTETITITHDGETYENEMPDNLGDAQETIRFLLEIIKDKDDIIATLEDDYDLIYKNNKVLVFAMNDYLDTINNDNNKILNQLNKFNYLPRTLGIYTAYTNNDGGMGGKLGLILNIHKMMLGIGGGIFYHNELLNTNMLPVSYTFDIFLGYWLF